MPNTFTENYDFKNFAYYIRIDIGKEHTSANETIYAVALQDSRASTTETQSRGRLERAASAAGGSTLP